MWRVIEERHKKSTSGLHTLELTHTHICTHMHTHIDTTSEYISMKQPKYCSGGVLAEHEALDPT